jgi:WD40 repeat protein
MLRLRGHTDSVRAVAYSPDGQSLASGSADGTAVLWELPVYSVAIARDGMTAAAGGLEDVVIWDRD